MFEVWIESNIWWIILSFFGIVAFWQFRKWNVERIKAKGNIKKAERKEQGLKLDSDIQQYINNPEQAITVLRADRIVKEREHNTKGIEAIDTQIKMLEYLVKIPQPIRPFVGKIGTVGMKRITSLVEDL